ncbi:hypothetical protein KSS87_017400 [Heliosperma pusillum]|nr:hypothetical protein KSS87_017400 [Heliosperma pusillum]
MLTSIFFGLGSVSLWYRQTPRRIKNFPWQRNLLEESLAAAGLPGMESGTKLYISNLDSGVSNNDIRELFSEIGELKRYAIHFDRSGRPSGSAEVVYAKRSDAYAAHKRYNNVQLDGRPMKIEVAIPTAEVPVSAHMNHRLSVTAWIFLFYSYYDKILRLLREVAHLCARQSGSRPIAVVPTSRGIGQRIRGGFMNGRGRGMGRGQGEQRGRGRGRGKKQEKSAEELDKELEKYHAQGMNVD